MINIVFGHSKTLHGCIMTNNVRRCVCWQHTIVVTMGEKKTSELNAILKNASLADFDKIRMTELPKKALSLSEYLNTYIGNNGLVTADVIRSSLLSRDYAYSILNGNRPNPTRDRVIALCIAMHMNLEEVQRALELCNAGILYPKDARDMAIIICINTSIYDIAEINDFLVEKGFDVLHTSKDV